MEKLYTCKDIAAMFSVKEDTVWSWIRSGKLKAVRIGRLYRVYQTALDAFRRGE